MNKSFKILTLITGLSTGGAEVMLYNILSKMDLKTFQTRVISLKDIGSIGEKIKALGVSVDALGMDRGFYGPLNLSRLFFWIRRNPPHIVQTWMYHADLLGLISTRLLNQVKLVWNIRCSNVPFNKYRPLTGWIVRICSLFSKAPDAIIVNSKAGFDQHRKMGYNPKNMKLIPNGVDTFRFKPDIKARAEVRREISLPEDAIAIGLVARWDPLKDHHTFLKAAGILAREQEDVFFVLVGEGINWKNRKLSTIIEDSGIRKKVLLLDHRDDIPRVTASLDIACSSSITEGFPNTVAEAMACEIPCVVTDVGDSAIIVGNTGRVVPARDPVSFAFACRELILMGNAGRKELGKKARERIIDNYMLENVAKEYEKLYMKLLRNDHESMCC